MYEDFTDRSRRVMQLANQEAQRFNQERIGSEHILLGLLKEGSGVAAHALASLGVELGKVRRIVEDRIEGTSTFVMGKLPQTEDCKAVIQQAIKESHEIIGHSYVGTEHILLGLIGVEKSTAKEILAGLSVTAEAVHGAVLTLLGLHKTPQEKKFTYATAISEGGESGLCVWFGGSVVIISDGGAMAICGKGAGSMGWKVYPDKINSVVLNGIES